MRIKQVIVARRDLNMSAGKLAAQAAHAAIHAYDKAEPSCVDTWRRSGVTKVVLAVNSEQELLEIYKQAVAAYLPAAMICDEGRTEVEPGSVTCVGVGPDCENLINKITGKLELY